MEKIFSGETQLAVIIKSADFPTGYNFISPNEWLFQIGFNNYPAGGKCEPHEHILKNQPDLPADLSPELLHIMHGSCIVNMYWRDKIVKSVTLEDGDTVLLIQGGHSLVMNKETKILEVKLGPYLSRESDKRIFPWQN